MDSNPIVVNGNFEVNATITPQELANLLDLVTQAPLAVGVTLKHVAPVFARASQLASLPAGTRIGALPAEGTPDKEPPAAGVQLELPLPKPGDYSRKRRIGAGTVQMR